MERKFLEDLGLDKETVDKVMAQNGADIERHKARAVCAEESVKELTKQLEKSTEDLANLEKSAIGNEELEKQLAMLKEENEKLVQEFEEKTNDVKVTNALKMALNGKVYDMDIVLGLFDKSRIVLDENDNIKAGFDEQFAPIQKNKSFLCITETKGTPKVRGLEPYDSSRENKGESKESSVVSFARGLGGSVTRKNAGVNPYFKL